MLIRRILIFLFILSSSSIFAHAQESDNTPPQDGPTQASVDQTGNAAAPAATSSAAPTSTTGCSQIQAQEKAKWDQQFQAHQLCVGSSGGTKGCSPSAAVLGAAAGTTVTGAFGGEAAAAEWNSLEEFAAAQRFRNILNGYILSKSVGSTTTGGATAAEGATAVEGAGTAGEGLLAADAGLASAPVALGVCAVGLAASGPILNAYANHQDQLNSDSQNSVIQQCDSDWNTAKITISEEYKTQLSQANQTCDPDYIYNLSAHQDPAPSVADPSAKPVADPSGRGVASDDSLPSSGPEKNVLDEQVQNN